MDHVTSAVQAFLDGYNCAQAVAVAFCDLTGMDKDLVKVQVRITITI